MFVGQSKDKPMTEATDSKGYDDDNSHMAARTGDMVQIINGRGEFMFALQTPFTQILSRSTLIQ